MIAVPMADDHVLDRGRIEAHFLHAADDFVLDGVIENRVDDDDAFRGGYCPDRPFGLTEPVQIVEHLDRFCVPLLARWSRARRRASSRSRGSLTGRKSGPTSSGRC